MSCKSVCGGPPQINQCMGNTDIHGDITSGSQGCQIKSSVLCDKCTVAVFMVFLLVFMLVNRTFLTQTDVRSRSVASCQIPSQMISCSDEYRLHALLLLLRNESVEPAWNHLRSIC